MKCVCVLWCGHAWPVTPTVGGSVLGVVSLECVYVCCVTVFLSVLRFVRVLCHLCAVRVVWGINCVLCRVLFCVLRFPVISMSEFVGVYWCFLWLFLACAWRSLCGRVCVSCVRYRCGACVFVSRVWICMCCVSFVCVGL